MKRLGFSRSLTLCISVCLPPLCPRTTFIIMIDMKFILQSNGSRVCYGAFKVCIENGIFILLPLSFGDECWAASFFYIHYVNNRTSHIIIYEMVEEKNNAHPNTERERDAGENGTNHFLAAVVQMRAPSQFKWNKMKPQNNFSYLRKHK